MNAKPLTPFTLLMSAAVAFAAGEGDASLRPLQYYTKNVARQHVGSNLFLFNSTNRAYQQTEAAAAWLDDDVTTGWPIMAGQQHYLLTLSEPMLLTNFAVSTRPASGTVTLYAGDEPAAPGAKSWTVLAKGVPLEAINERKLDHPFSRFAKYLLIETDIADPGPLFGLYVYGDRPAVNYQLHKREAAIDTHAIFGPYVNAATTYSVSALYAHSTVSYANASGGFASWQKAIDENPESSVNILPTTDEAGMVVKLAAGHQLGRFAVLTGAPAKGKLDFFVVPAAPSDAAGSDITKASNSTSPAASEVAKAPSLAGLTPTISLALDGSTTRSSIDFPKTEGSAVMLRWTPETAGSPISIRELNAFNEVSLNEYELALTPEAVAELRSGGKRVTGNGYDAGKDGKDYKDGKDLPPVGEFLSPRSPYLPGGLGFPPNVTRRVGGPGPTPVSP